MHVEISTHEEMLFRTLINLVVKEKPGNLFYNKYNVKILLTPF
jgi:hypothetical protein